VDISADKNIIAYTDGSFRKELKIGDWSAVIIDDNQTSEFCQGGFATDAITMELRAIILALENTPVNSNVTIYSDAKSLIYVIQSRIISNKKNIPLKNGEFWQYLKKLIRIRNVSCVWIKGHSGIEGNVRANQLAYQALLEFKKCPYSEEIKELLSAEIPTKYKAKKSLLLDFALKVSFAPKVLHLHLKS
jgi:ribonuclease HI